MENKTFYDEEKEVGEAIAKYTKEGLEWLFIKKCSADELVEWHKYCAIYCRTYETRIILDLAIIGFAQAVKGKSYEEIAEIMYLSCNMDNYAREAIDIIGQFCFGLDRSESNNHIFCIA